MNADFKKLEKHLSETEKTKKRVRLSFSEIEGIIGGKLPQAAHELRTWWSNQKSDKQPHKKAWLDAGFIVVKVKFSKEYVDFLKIK